jgi:S-formylglutathione hydrolase FrmB
MTVWSAEMNRGVAVLVVAPGTPTEDSATAFPTLYLLHGYGATGETWRSVARLERLSDTHRVIFVCPSGGNSWWLDSPSDPSNRFATFVARELVRAIDSAFATSADRTGRALLGSSMGGNGAVTILARFPDTFRAAGSIGGALDLREWTVRWELESLLGPLAGSEQAWLDQSAVAVAPQIRDTTLFVALACGLQDPALASNRLTCERLRESSVRHSYRESRGGHNQRFVGTQFESMVSELLRELRVARR